MPGGVRSGWFVLEPKNQWLLKEYEVHYDNPKQSGVVTGNLEYSHDGLKNPIISRVIGRTTITDIDTKQIVAVLDNVTECNLSERQVADSDFTLSAFGFPEPLDAASKPHWHTRWWLLAAIMGFVCLGGAFLFKRLAARGASHG